VLPANIVYPTDILSEHLKPKDRPAGVRQADVIEHQPVQFIRKGREHVDAIGLP
jgi:hypothetical protein